MAKRKGQTIIYKTLHRIPKVDQEETPGMNAGISNFYITCMNEFELFLEV
jgi:hypothetical protein